MASHPKPPDKLCYMVHTVVKHLMDSLLKRIPWVTPFFDDVLISAPTAEEFAAHLRSVLQHFNFVGLKVKREKCLLGVDYVDFLGLTIDAEGNHSARDKVKAISEALVPIYSLH